MSKRSEQATQRAVEVAQARTKRLHNAEIARLEAEHRQAEQAATERRATIRVVR